MPEQGTQTAQTPVATMTEAAFSMNVKMLDGSGQEVMLTFRCPMANQAEKLIEHYNNMVGKLLAAGWQTLTNGARATQNNAPANGGAVPVCRVHGRQMKPSRKPGSFYCSSKLADGSYCTEKVDA